MSVARTAGTCAENVPLPRAIARADNHSLGLISHGTLTTAYNASGQLGTGTREVCGPAVCSTIRRSKQTETDTTQSETRILALMKDSNPTPTSRNTRATPELMEESGRDAG
jgi:hypothetical protein